jgi:hypothetical protein
MPDPQRHGSGQCLVSLAFSGQRRHPSIVLGRAGDAQVSLATKLLLEAVSALMGQ